MAPNEINNGDCIELCIGLPELEIPIECPLFSYMGSVWNFKLFAGMYTNCKRWYSASLNKTDKNPLLKSFKIDIEVGVTHDENINLEKQSLSVACNSVNVWHSSQKQIEPNFPPGYRTGNVLKFLFRFYLPSDPVVKVNSKSHEKSVQTSSYADTRILLDSVSKTFSKLLDEGPNHDIQFICEDEIISAHKNVLCCSSDVLSEMVEAETEVDIYSMDPIVFRQFLKFLYTGTLPELTVGTAIELYEASVKYAVDSLKQLCADFLVDNLSLENACNILILADRHSDDDLKKSAMTYIFKEKIPIVGGKWNDFCKKNQKLAIEVLSTFFQHHCTE